VGLRSRSAEVARFEAINCADVPLADPVRLPTDGQCRSVGDAGPEIYLRPVERIEEPQVSQPIAVHIADKVAVVPPHLPTRRVAVVPSHQLQPASCRAQEADVRNCPVASVEYVDIRPAVAVEVADEELVSSTELPAWHAAVVARNQVHLPGAIVGNQAQV